MTMLLDSFRALTKLKHGDTPTLYPSPLIWRLLGILNVEISLCFNLMSSKLIALFNICSTKIYMSIPTTH